jgi:phosphoglycerate dehydrogenase-like enzyme
MRRPKGLYVMGSPFFEMVYGPRERADLELLVDIYAPPQTPESIRANPALLEDCEMIFSSWGGPKIDETFLDAAPRLKVVFYAAGAANSLITDAMWQRGVQLTSAYVANAVPVVEYTLSMILFSLKQGWRYVREIKSRGAYPEKWIVPGAFRTTVGIVSMGAIARMLCEKLRSFDLNIIAYDPYLSPEDAKRLGVSLASLEEVFQKADVVSLHAPSLAETNGMINEKLLRSLKNGAALINTARGSVINESDLIKVASDRPDLQMVLDVTDPEPPVPGSPLYSLPNVILTPHIAGSMNDECHRMARYMIDELNRYLKGEPMHWVITPELARTSSHRPSFMNSSPAN